MRRAVFLVAEPTRFPVRCGSIPALAPRFLAPWTARRWSRRRGLSVRLGTDFLALAPGLGVGVGSFLAPSAAVLAFPLLFPLPCFWFSLPAACPPPEGFPAGFPAAAVLSLPG